MNADLIASIIKAAGERGLNCQFDGKKLYLNNVRVSVLKRKIPKHLQPADGIDMKILVDENNFSDYKKQPVVVIAFNDIVQILKDIAKD